MHVFFVFFQPKGWRFTKKTHASSPSTSGKSHEKTSVIQTRPTVVFIFSTGVSFAIPLNKLMKMMKVKKTKKEKSREGLG